MQACNNETLHRVLATLFLGACAEGGPDMWSVEEIALAAVTHGATDAGGGRQDEHRVLCLSSSKYERLCAMLSCATVAEEVRAVPTAVKGFGAVVMPRVPPEDLLRNLRALVVGLAYCLVQALLARLDVKPEANNEATLRQVERCRMAHVEVLLHRLLEAQAAWPAASEGSFRPPTNCLDRAVDASRRAADRRGWWSPADAAWMAEWAREDAAEAAVTTCPRRAVRKGAAATREAEEVGRLLRWTVPAWCHHRWKSPPRAAISAPGTLPSVRLARGGARRAQGLHRSLHLAPRPHHRLRPAALGPTASEAARMPAPTAAAEAASATSA